MMCLTAKAQSLTQNLTLQTGNGLWKVQACGENYVKEFTTKHFIVRSTWVYGKGQNFINGFLKKWTQASSYRSPLTSLDHRQVQTNWQDFYYIWCIQASTELIMRQTRACHDRYAFAQEILKMTGKTASMHLAPTVMSDFSKVRLAYAVLDNFIMSMVPIYDFPDWQDSLREYLEERGLYHAE